MKKLLIILLSFSFNSFIAQSDTLCNPSFEDSLNNWGTFCNGSSVGTYTINNSSAYSGNFGLEMDVSSISPPSNTCALTSCSLDLQQGKFYMISFWAKSNSFNDVLVVLQRTSAPFTNYIDKTLTLTTSWKKYELYTSDSNSVSNLKIKIKPQVDGVYTFDDFNFMPITTLPTNVEICNGDFENGLSNWSNSNNNGNISVFSDSTNFQNGNYGAKIVVSNSNNGQPIFSSCKSDINKNKKYKIHFWAKSLFGGDQMIVTSSLGSSPFTNYGMETFTISNNWSEYTFLTESDSTIYANVRLAKFKFLNDATYFIDNVWIEELPIQPYFCDGDFETDLSNWTQTINNGAIASMSVTPSQAQNGFQSAMVLINTVGTSPGSIQLTSCKTDIVKDSIYTVSFWMKGSANNMSFNAISSLASPPYTSFASNSFSTTNNWKEYCYSFSHDSTIIGNVRLLKIQFLDVGTFYLDDATINSSDYICSSISSINNTYNKSFKFFPNPVTNTLNINNLNNEFSYVVIRDFNGKEIQQSSLMNKNKTSISTVYLSKGMYFFKMVKLNGEIYNSNFIKN